MARASRNLIVLSDGTGNSAAKAFKTNVWRLYQALRLGDGSQVAEFGDGVGTSSITFLRIIGLALGIGVKRNVLNLYKFLCHNYWQDTNNPDQHDRIWMFGFSRGAFTIRVLAGLVASQGLVEFETEAELNKNAVAAYRAFREDRFRPKYWWVFWVPLGRRVRNCFISGWNAITGSTPYRDVKKRKHIKIEFIGVWDTVAAYGLPIDELSIAVDKWVWPMNFRDTSLLDCVQHARHAMALDDERRTFHPIPWDEHAEKRKKRNHGEVDPDRLTQVWFPGVHSDVGGGYPDDGLSLVPLCWMIDEAKKKGLQFEDVIVEEYRALASPTGRMYDSRGGITGGLWRYQPRNAQFLMDNSDDKVPKDERITPLVHHCVMTRMTYGNDGYAPKSLPFKIDILLPNNARVPFDSGAVAAALQPSTDDATARVLGDLKALIARATAQANRGDYFALVLDSIWLRRCTYFVTLGLALILLTFPAVHSLLDWFDKTPPQLRLATGGAEHYLLDLFKGFIPSYAAPWVDAIKASPQPAANVIVLFIISLLVSGFQRRRIQDRARASWNVQPKVAGQDIKRLQLAGQRHALAAAVVVLVVVAILSFGNWVSFGLALAGAAMSLGLLLSRRKKPMVINPAKPPFPLNLARGLRRSKRAVAAYRWTARTALPALFILIAAWLALSAMNLGLYDLRSTRGDFCPGNDALARIPDEKLDATPIIDIKSPCAGTGIRLVARRPYRIQIEPGKDNDAWFDRGLPADVAGFGVASSGAHFAGMTLRRWWRENYFQPIARIGRYGNYEYPLHPAAPLPKVDFSACGHRGRIDPVPGAKTDPAPEADRLNFLKCEERENIKRNAVLIADIIPDSSGELYIYVNDAVFFWDSKDHHRFYLNNNGKAKVTVTRTLAPATVDYKAP